MANKFGEALRNNMKESENRVEQAINGQPEPIVNNEQSGVAPSSLTLSPGEPTKGISVKLPYDLYDALDVLKKRSQRTGNRNDKMGIGDLVVLAVKEFVEKYEGVNA